MGNKMCKKKVDTVDNPKSPSPSPFDRIITRLHLKPNTWKSDSHLNAKRTNRNDVLRKNVKNGLIPPAKQITKSKSTDWTEADLEVPEKDEVIHLKNPQLTFIFNDNTTPTPPPRKHKKSIREKIETVAKSGMQALQARKPEDTKKQEEKKPAEEVVCTKKIIKYGCPCEDRGTCTHKHDKKEADKHVQTKEKDGKRKKNLSVSSLPNYSELKFSVANSENSTLRHIDSSKSNSTSSLPEETKASPAVPTGRLENYMTRCRSFGSLINNKFKVPKEPANVESDDSFGGLEDWDLGILEHYNPRDASLPRPKKPINETKVLSEMEKLIVPEEEIETTPMRPVRRSESLIKKMNRQASEAALSRSKEILNSDCKIENEKNPPASCTPPPSPQSRNENTPPICVYLPSTEEDRKIEHSSLMRILQEFSTKNMENRADDSSLQTKEHSIKVQPASVVSNKDGLPSSLKSVTIVTKDFINAEKVCVS